jgi:hypothetical protein
VVGNNLVEAILSTVQKERNQYSKELLDMQCSIEVRWYCEAPKGGSNNLITR